MNLATKSGLIAVILITLLLQILSKGYSFDLNIGQICFLKIFFQYCPAFADSLDCMKYARDIAATLKCNDCEFTRTFNHQPTNTCTSHTSSIEKPYACTQCDYRCGRRGQLQRHENSYRGETVCMYSV